MGEISDFMRRYLEEPRYCLADYDEETIQAARRELVEKIKGVVNEVAEAKADQLVAQLLQTSFAEDDSLNFSFDFAMNGTEFLGMLGAAKLRREAEKKRQRRNSCPKNCDCCRKTC